VPGGPHSWFTRFHARGDGDSGLSINPLPRSLAMAAGHSIESFLAIFCPPAWDRNTVLAARTSTSVPLPDADLRKSFPFLDM